MGASPSYIRLYRTGELQQRIIELERLMSPCTLCPRDCLVQRCHHELGLCKAGDQLLVAAFLLLAKRCPNSTATAAFTPMSLR